MRFIFYGHDSEMKATAGTIALADDLPPVMAADLWQDVVFEAIREYNKARVRCGWEPSAQLVT